MGKKHKWGQKVRKKAILNGTVFVVLIVFLKSGIHTENIQLNDKKLK